MTRWMIVGLAATLSGAVGAELGTLADAAKNADRNTLQALLKSGANVNAAQGDGTTALHWASYRDDLDAADLLIGRDGRAWLPINSSHQHPKRNTSAGNGS